MDSPGNKDTLDPCFLRYLNFIKETKQQMMKCSPVSYDIPYIKTEIKDEPVSSECEVNGEYSDYSSDNFKNEDSEGSSSYSSMFSTKEEPLNLLIKTEIKDEEEEEEEDEMNNDDEDEDMPDFCVEDHLSVSCDIKEEMTFEENEIASSCGYESDFSNNPYDVPINLSLKKWEDSSSDADGVDNHIEQDFMKFLQEHNPQNLADVGIPMTVDDIIHLPLTTFRDRLSKCNLTGAQIRMLKDLRRRGKNRMYSQNSRRKRTNHILKLKQDLNAVRICKARLFLERQCIMAKRDALEKKFMQLYFLVFKECAFNDRESIPVSGEQLISAIANQKNSVMNDLNVNIIDVDEDDDNDYSNAVSPNHDQTVPASMRNLLADVQNGTLIKDSFVEGDTSKKCDKISLNDLLGDVPNDSFMQDYGTGPSPMSCSSKKHTSKVSLSSLFGNMRNDSLIRGIGSSAKSDSSKKRNKTSMRKRHKLLFSKKYPYNSTSHFSKKSSDMFFQNFEGDNISNKSDDLPTNTSEEASNIKEQSVDFSEGSSMLTKTNVTCDDVSKTSAKLVDTQQNTDAEKTTEAVDLRICCAQDVSAMFASKIRCMINETNDAPTETDSINIDDNPVNNGDNHNNKVDNHVSKDDNFNENDSDINEGNPVDEDEHHIDEDQDNHVDKDDSPVNENDNHIDTDKPINEDNPVNEDNNLVNEDNIPVNKDDSPVNEDDNPLSEDGKHIIRTDNSVEEDNPATEVPNVNISDNAGEISHIRCRESESPEKPS